MMVVEAVSDGKEHTDMESYSASPTPFLGSLTDSILILLDEHKVDDAIGLIRAFMNSSSYPEVSTTRQLLKLITQDSTTDVHEVALFVTLYSHLLSVHGPVIFTHMWVPSQTGTGTFWAMVRRTWGQLSSAIRHSKEPETHKTKMIMDLLVDVATRTVMSDNTPEKMTEAIVGVMGRRRGLPVGVSEAIEVILEMSIRSPHITMISTTICLAAQWFNVLGMVQCAHDTIDFLGQLSEKACEVVRVISKMRFDLAESGPSTLPEDDTAEGTVNDKTIDKIPTRSFNFQWYYHQTLVEFVRALCPGEFLLRFCDYVMMSTNVYPISVRHLAKTTPSWQKIVQLHLQSKPARVTLGALWVHALLLSRMLGDMDLDAEQKEHASKMVRMIVDEIQGDLFIAKDKRAHRNGSAGTGRGKTVIETPAKAGGGRAAVSSAAEPTASADDDRDYPISASMRQWAVMMEMLIE
ncbi:hypothetical protein BASA50_008906 [Batrachochytrium salamandrivorans]|uniref:Symplekin/Pta1 N-terminal domain-containing protein n=1 Tax=Batrachochytrium salamandrivorans TaxID=1357716 RepID=A0ABQ8F2A0_9FUNG|nr:hypothetical protein BASA60_005923 [Batrachochytrium salamandrivorans]KAH6590905.1 hypothetical protein BASA50_008906 [Batrachochytrium salamandrivorans]KAH6598765.1 hypothetical protein BASA61_002840 [Batrachochytrium salamandrivorans]KAH9268358.1 hypothetical protein BASA84_000272 [Batrachochytrium salamandrivorans]KAJ1343324.1 hypothetical protein BSLG_002350 [Batrachochytrium salamandrivorans]